MADSADGVLGSPDVMTGRGEQETPRPADEVRMSPDGVWLGRADVEIAESTENLPRLGMITLQLAETEGPEKASKSSCSAAHWSWASQSSGRNVEPHTYTTTLDNHPGVHRFNTAPSARKVPPKGQVCPVMIEREIKSSLVQCRTELLGSLPCTLSKYNRRL